MRYKVKVRKSQGSLVLAYETLTIFSVDSIGVGDVLPKRLSESPDIIRTIVNIQKIDHE